MNANKQEKNFRFYIMKDLRILLKLVLKWFTNFYTIVLKDLVFKDPINAWTNRPTPVRRRVSLTQAVRGKLIPTCLVLVLAVKVQIGV